MRNITLISLFAYLSLLFMQANGQSTIVFWDFDDEAKRTLVTNSDEISDYASDYGDGELYLLNGPVFSAWDGGAGSDYAPNTNGWDEGEGTAYWAISFSTEGFKDITVSSAQRSSNTGPRDFTLEYRIGEIGDWEHLTDITVASNFTTGVVEEFELPEECENEELVFIRWLMETNTSVNGGTVGGQGTNRIDEIEVSGNCDIEMHLAFNEIVTESGETVHFCNNESVSLTIDNIITGGDTFRFIYQIDEETPVEVTGIQEGEVILQEQMTAGTYQFKIIEVEGDFCYIADAEGIYTAEIIVKDEPAVLFSINDTEIYEGYELELCYGENVEVKFQEALIGEYPFTISWTINGNTEHELAGNEVEVTEENQVLLGGILEAGIYHIEITEIVDGEDCSVSETAPYNATVVVNPEPAVLFSINDNEIYEGYELELCYGENVEVKFQEAIIGEYPFTISWSVNGDTEHELAGNEVEVTEDNQVLLGGVLDAGTYHIEITDIVDGEGCSVTETAPYNATIVVNPEPAVLFSINDTEIYEGYEAVLCYGENVEVKFHEAIIGEYPFTISWSVNGDTEHELAGNEVEITEANQILFEGVLDAGTYHIEITEIIDDAGCEVNDVTPYNATVVVNQEPAVLFSINDTEIYEGYEATACYGENVQVMFQEALEGAYPFTISWSVNGDDEHELAGSEVEITDEHQILFDESLDMGAYHIDITEIVDGHGCPVSDVSPYNATIVVEKGPEVSFAINNEIINEESDINICSGDNVNIMLYEVNEGDFPITISYEVIGENETYTGENIALFEAEQVFFSNNLPAGEYEFNVTAIAGGNHCQATDLSIHSTQFSINPEFSHVQDIPDIPICFGTTMSNLQDILPSHIYVYDIDGHYYASNISWDIDNSFNGESVGEYDLVGTVSVPQSLCAESYSIELDLTLIVMMDYSFDLGENIHACKGDEIVLTAPMADSYTWNNESTQQSIVATTPGYYHVEVTQATCFAEDSVYIFFHDFPAAFSLGTDFNACIGDVVELEGPDIPNNFSYLWNTGATTQSIDVETPGIYELTVFTNYGCATSDYIHVGFNDYLIISIYEQDTLFACQNDTLELNPFVVAEEYMWSWGEEETSTDNTIHVYDNNWYTISVYSENCGSATDSIFVYFHQLPEFVLGDDMDFCEGEAHEIDGPDGDYEYLWTTGETTQTITVTEHGIYYCTITDVNNCQYNDSIFVTVYDLPYVDLGYDNTIDQEQTVILAVESGHPEYIWNTGDTGNSIVVDGSELSLGDHTFSVTVTSNEDCVASNSVVITVIEGLFVDENFEAQVSIYPNPATDKLFVNIENYTEEINIRITNLSGQTISMFNTNSSVTEIDVNNLSSGTYFLIIEEGNSRMVNKITIE